MTADNTRYRNKAWFSYLRLPHSGPRDVSQENREHHVQLARGMVPTNVAEGSVMGYNASRWLAKIGAVLTSERHQDYTIQTLLHHDTDVLARSINQVSLPRNNFDWHPVPELKNIPVNDGNPSHFAQQYIMVQPSEQLVAGILNARRMVPQTQTPMAYGQPLVTNSDSGVTVVPVVTPVLWHQIDVQANSGSRFFQWLRDVIQQAQNS